MSLLRFDKVSLAFGHHDLLTAVDFTIDAGEKVCLLGRNGEGKSTLLKLISGELAPDDGTIRLRSGARVACLAQTADAVSGSRVFDVVASGLPETGALIGEYQEAAATLGDGSDTRAAAELERLQHELEAGDGWRLNQRVGTVLSRLALDGAAQFAALSGGQQRRVLLARALVCEPDLLLLDEPTNHLDIEAIAWLEEFAREFAGALLFVSHDRAFVRRVATRICELDRGKLSSWETDYDTYKKRKLAQLEVEAREAHQADKLLAQEEAWVRQGIKARRTRNEGRVRALEALREKRRQRREQRANVSLSVADGEVSGRVVFETEHATVGFDGKPVIADLSLRILRGDRVGIIGPNGAGKSTLIRLLLGELPPDSGRVHRGTKLQIAYFDQRREQLDPERTVMDSVADGNQRVRINGSDRHVAGYLRDFLFPPQRLQSPVSSLSGGERNRLLLARLFTRPANLLVLDEPTNDLDVETLELLEELVADFDGTILLVSHDRAFLDNVVTSTLVFEGNATVTEYVGGYSDWLRQRGPAPAARGRTKPAAEPRGAAPRAGGTAKPPKLSYKENRELEMLPARIEALETEQANLQRATSDADFYQQDRDAIKIALGRLEELAAELELAYARWEYLDAAHHASAKSPR
ncbi:MAG: ABC transporter ATP-binding protein [Chromatiales bacterium]|nr:MAG: ABC transporter ATP-binding protein [Chromatiales bacterium]